MIMCDMIFDRIYHIAYVSYHIYYNILLYHYECKQGEKLRSNLLDRYYGKSLRESRKDTKFKAVMQLPSAPTHGPGSQMLRRAAMTLAEVQVSL